MPWELISGRVELFFIKGIHLNNRNSMHWIETSHQPSQWSALSKY